MKKNKASKANKEQSKFSILYNSDAGKRTVGAVYSIGAAVVIVGALFKLMHWPMAGVLLTIGMFTEAILFTIGVFEKPHKEYEWDRVFSFDGEGQALAGAGSLPAAGKDGGAMAAAGKLNEKELASLSDGIKSLAETAKDLSSLSVAMGSAKKFTEHMEAATGVAAQYAEVQRPQVDVGLVLGNLLLCGSPAGHGQRYSECDDASYYHIKNNAIFGLLLYFLPPNMALRLRCMSPVGRGRCCRVA